MYVIFLSIVKSYEFLEFRTSFFDSEASSTQNNIRAQSYHVQSYPHSEPTCIFYVLLILFVMSSFQEIKIMDQIVIIFGRSIVSTGKAMLYSVSQHNEPTILIKDTVHTRQTIEESTDREIEKEEQAEKEE